MSGATLSLCLTVTSNSYCNDLCFYVFQTCFMFFHVFVIVCFGVINVGYKYSSLSIRDLQSDDTSGTL